MRNLMTVINFSIKEMITKKSFIISTAIILILIVLAFNIPNILSNTTDGETYFGRIVIIDEEDIFEGNLKVLEKTESNYKFKNQKANLIFRACSLIIILILLVCFYSTNMINYFDF